jgi:lysozyme
VNLAKLEAQLAIDEGKRLVAYLDSMGILSCGIGHNCVAKPVAGVLKPGDTISEETCSRLFREDIQESIGQLDKHILWWRALDDTRQNVLCNMVFNLGIQGLLQFRNTLKFIECGSYGMAADGMLASLWARQVGDRAKRLAKQMRDGDKAMPDFSDVQGGHS